jgi:hypothetical protein
MTELTAVKASVIKFTFYFLNTKIYIYTVMLLYTDQGWKVDLLDNKFVFTNNCSTTSLHSPVDHSCLNPLNSVIMRSLLG